MRACQFHVIEGISGNDVYAQQVAKTNCAFIGTKQTLGMRRALVGRHRAKGGGTATVLQQTANTVAPAVLRAVSARAVWPVASAPAL